MASPGSSPLPKCGGREGSSSEEEKFPGTAVKCYWWMYWRWWMAVGGVTEEWIGSCLFYIRNSLHLSQTQLCIWPKHICVGCRNRFFLSVLSNMGFGTYLSNFIVENLWNFVQLWQLFPYIQVIILKGKTIPSISLLLAFILWPCWRGDAHATYRNQWCLAKLAWHRDVWSGKEQTFPLLMNLCEQFGLDRNKL